jgi:hypothetical protein
MPVEAVSQPIVVAIMSLLTVGHRATPPPDGPTLTISGNAAPTVVPAAFYSFTPRVLQSGDRPLQFTIKNKPSWASFGRKRGTIYGVPTTANAGSYPNIVITVSDGQNTVQLPPFSIRVHTPVAATTAGPG